jgi:hypothetical protein
MLNKLPWNLFAGVCALVVFSLTCQPSMAVPDSYHAKLTVYPSKPILGGPLVVELRLTDSKGHPMKHASIGGGFVDAKAHDYLAAAAEGEKTEAGRVKYGFFDVISFIDFPSFVERRPGLYVSTVVSDWEDGHYQYLVSTRIRPKPGAVIIWASLRINTVSDRAP